MNYDKRNWALIAAQLSRDHTAIHVINRAQLLDDALNLAKSGLLEYEVTNPRPALCHVTDIRPMTGGAEPDRLPRPGDGVHPLGRRALRPLLHQQDAQANLSIRRLQKVTLLSFSEV